MKKIKKGDKVGRRSYGNDIIFEVVKITNLSNGRQIALLKGITERIEVDSDVNDLELIDKKIIEKNINIFEKNLSEKINKNLRESKYKSAKNENETRISEQYINGKILHLDGDRKYSEKSLIYYKKMGLNAIVKNIAENRQSKLVYNLLMYYNPDILIVTRT